MEFEEWFTARKIEFSTSVSKCCERKRKNVDRWNEGAGMEEEAKDECRKNRCRLYE